VEFVEIIFVFILVGVFLSETNEKKLTTFFPSFFGKALETFFKFNGLSKNGNSIFGYEMKVRRLIDHSVKPLIDEKRQTEA
jgi:hypothetical protein